MKTGNLKITYDWRNSSQQLSMLCRQAGEHDLPEGGQEGKEQPGTYTCLRCHVIKRVRETLT